MFCCFLSCCKQTISVFFLTVTSLLLFAAAGASFYLSVMFTQQDSVFGVQATKTYSDSNSDGFWDFESIMNLLMLTAAFLAMLLSMFGICVACSRDQCSTLTFSFFSVSFTLILVGVASSLSGTLVVNSVEDFCGATEYSDLKPEPVDPAFYESWIYGIEKSLFARSKEIIEEVDTKLTGDGLVEDYMCKAKCPCDPMGLSNFQNWGQAVEDLKNLDFYFYNGQIQTFKQCQEKLLQEGELSEDRKLSTFLMYAIRNMEERLDCQGLCRNSRFWIQKTFYRSYPDKLCLQSYKDLIDDSDSIVFYAIASMTLLSVLQLSSICGICRSSDKVFLQDRKDSNDASNTTFGDGNSKVQEIEMPARASLYGIRQRNYVMD